MTGRWQASVQNLATARLFFWHLQFFRHHISWFIQLCALHGINFDCTMFTDRGHLLSAAKWLSSMTNLEFNLMCCIQHLKRNVFHKFPVFKEPHLSKKVKLLLETATKAETSFTFIRSFHEFSSQVTPLAGSTAAMSVAQCLLSIDPMHWSTMANNKSLFCESDHLQVTKQLHHHLASAVEFEVFLTSNNNDNFELLDDIDIHNQIALIHGLCFGDAPVHHDHHNNSRKCSCCGENKNNVGDSTGSMCFRSESRSKAPPDCCVNVLKNNNDMTRDFEEFFQPMVSSDPKKKSPSFS